MGAVEVRDMISQAGEMRLDHRPRAEKEQVSSSALERGSL
jgi:hypothetical protein